MYVAQTWKLHAFITCLILFFFFSLPPTYSKSVNYFVKTLEGNIYNLDTVEAKYAYMQSPSGLALGLNNDLFVSDIKRHVVFRIFNNLSTAEVYAGYISSGYNGDGLPAVGTLLNAPTAISVNPLNGDLYIADTLNDKIRIVSNKTRIVSSMQEKFNRPRGIYVSSNGFVYIADTENNLIKKFEISTQQLSTIAGGGYLSGEYDGVNAKLLRLQFPKNIHVVSNGNKDLVYFTDEERIKSIDENGIYRMVDGGNPQSNLFGIFVSNQGEIYSSSQTNHFIQMKLTKSLQTQLIIGSSESGYSGDNEFFFNSSNIKFNEPSSLVVFENSILIADKSNNCIRKVDLQSKIVSTIIGGLINHPYGENISPLKMYSYGAVEFPFTHSNNFYFVEKSVILRKVSNGKMTTVLGCEITLPYTSNILQRTHMIILHLSYIGNGDVYIMTNDFKFYNLNLDTLTLTPLGRFLFNYASFFTSIGNSFHNATIYQRTAANIISVFNASNFNSYYQLPLDSTGTISDIGVIPDLRYNGTSSIFFYSDNENSILEIIDYRNGSMTSSRTPLMIDASPFNGFSTYDRNLYFYNMAQLYEMDAESYSFRKIGGFDPYNVSGTLVYPMGFNGEDIPLNSSVLYLPKLGRSGSKLYVSNLYAMSEISNGRIFTVAGLTSISKTLTPIILMRDPLKKIIYYVDNRTLKKYDENTGISQPLTTSIVLSSTIPVNTPFLTLTIQLIAKAFGFFSTFDRKIYIKDSCRILRIDPETLEFENIIGNACSSSLVAGVKGLNSPCVQPSSHSGMTFDQDNGDLLISQEDSSIYRYSLKTQMISLEFKFDSNSEITYSPDGIISNGTSVGQITNIRHANGFLYFSTKVSIRRIEKLSDNSYYLRTIVGNSKQGYSGDKLPALESSLDLPTSFYVKKNGDIIILDGLGSFIVRMYQQETGLLVDIAGSRAIGAKYNGDGYVPYTTFASFSVKQVEFDESSGEIFLIDTRTFIRKIIPTCSENYVFNSVNSTCDLVVSCNGTLPASAFVCNGNGICSDFDTCQCSDEFEGRFCESKKSTELPTTNSTILIVSIVVPVIASLLVIIIIVVVIISIVICFQRRKKNEKLEMELTNVELTENPFFLNSSIISSSLGQSIGSDNDNPFSRYSNITKIGQGAFGSIFKATDTKNRNKLKAIKLIRFESLTDLNTVMKEASQFSCVNHPNIVKVNDYFITNDSLLIIDMDYYEMGDLAQLKPEHCTETLIKQILKQMLQALVYIHEELHIIHRDIKPSNIFVKKLTKNDIEIVLADFGLAKKYQESKGQSYAGTPLYMSPEVALGSSYSFNTDVFSLGVSIYQIMTSDNVTSISNLLMGNQAENANKILTNQMKESSNKEFSDELIEIVLKMVEKDAKTRLSASQLLSLKYFK